MDILIIAGANDFIVLYKGEASKAEIEEYGSRVRLEIYLRAQIRVDIVFIISVLSRFLSNPSP
jgi:hypothetical protein